MAKIDEWLEKDHLILLEGWAREGLIDEQIAKNMGIACSTYYEWKKKSPEISEALKKNKDMVDFEVENALYKNAMNGNVTAQIFWLKNRRKNKWRDKVEYEANTDELNKVKELLSKIESEANNDENNVEETR